MAQVEIEGPLHLTVLKGLTGGLHGAEALTHQTAGSTLLPLEHLIKTEAGAPLALLGQVAVLIGTVNPIEPAIRIDEMTIPSLLDACHGQLWRLFFC